MVTSSSELLSEALPEIANQLAANLVPGSGAYSALPITPPANFDLRDLPKLQSRFEVSNVGFYQFDGFSEVAIYLLYPKEEYAHA